MGWSLGRRRGCPPCLPCDSPGLWKAQSWVEQPCWTLSWVLTSELNNSPPDHLIELKFGTLNHLRMYIIMLMSEQLSTAVISCQQLFFSCRDRRKSMLEASYAKVCLAKCSGNCLEMNFEYWNFSVAQKLTELRIFFFFSSPNIWAVFFLTRKYYVSLCRYSGVIWHFLGALNCCQLIFSC